MLIARVRFCSWDRSSWHWTTIPVGRWVRRTAVAFFWTFCPPAPPELKTSILMSFSGMSISISLASANTATVAVEVWMRPCDSVTGTRCTRWTPDSYLRRAEAARPPGCRMNPFCPPSPAELQNALFQPADAGVAGRQRFGFPAVFLGVAGVHPEQIGSEEGCLVTARPGPDFQDDIAVAAWIFGEEQVPDLELELPGPRRELCHFGFGQRPHLRVVRSQQLPRLGQLILDGAPGPIGAHQWLDVGPFLTQRGVALVIASGNGQFLLEALVAADDGF